MKIYADVFFLINLSMDMALYSAVGALAGVRVKKRLLLPACAVSALFPVVSLVLPMRFPFDGICLFLVALLVSALVFDTDGLSALFVVSALFLTFSSVLTGLLTRIFASLGGRLPGFIEAAGAERSGKGGILPLLISALSLLFSLVSGSFGRKCAKKRGSRSRKGSKVSVRVVTGGRSAEFTGYRDSGNLLREPFGRTPVVIVGEQRMREIIPRSLYGVFFPGEKSSPCDDPDISEARRIRVIPVTQIGGRGVGILFGYVPDRIYIDGREENACVALDRSGNDFGGCDSLVPEILMTVK